jgi:hypothetical protein
MLDQRTTESALPLIDADTPSTFFLHWLDT